MTATRWTSVPGVPAPPLRATRTATVELLALVVCAGPYVRARQFPPSALPVLLALVAGSVALLVLGRAPGIVRLLVAAGVGLALQPSFGTMIAVWTTADLVLADWAIRGRPTVPALRAPTAEIRPAVTVLSLVAAWRGTSAEAQVGVLLVIALSFALVAAQPWVGARVAAWTSALGRGASQAVSAVGFTLLGVLVVVVPWAFQRVVRTDPLSGRVDPGRSTGWIPRQRIDVRAAEPWSRDPSALRPSPAQRFRTAAAFSCIIAACVGLALWQRDRSQRDPEPITLDAPAQTGDDFDDPAPGIPAAYQGDDWYPQYEKDIEWVMDLRAAYRPLRLFRLVDVHSTTVNVEGGFRKTWTPPACSCPRLTVWMYGGSTTFGIGQRDEGTIASRLAEQAWEQGIALDISNRGMPGQLHWNEASRFQWDLSVDDPPDLVVFYDGVNEVMGAAAVGPAGLAGTQQPVDPGIEDVWVGIADTIGDPPPAPDGAGLDPIPPDPQLDGAGKGQAGAVSYAASLKMSRDLGLANDLPIRWYYQPSRFSRDPVDGEVRRDDETELAAMYHTAESQVPKGVVDLTDVFDPIAEPLFSDEVHHNERGANVVAAAILADLRPRIDELLAARSGATGP